LRRIAHYDYWQDKVRRAILIDAKADLLLYGNAERAIGGSGASPGGQRSHCATSPMCEARRSCVAARRLKVWFEIDSTEVDMPGRVESHVNPIPDGQRASHGTGRELCPAR
jgi:hypothetical protein